MSRYSGAEPAFFRPEAKIVETLDIGPRGAETVSSLRLEIDFA